MNSLEKARAALKKETQRNHRRFVDHLRRTPPARVVTGWRLTY
jgi:hypothetical protein